MRAPPRLVLAAFAAMLASHIVLAQGGSTATPFHKQRVSFKSGDLTLYGFVYRPEGPGPFPTVVWNHGSERSPGVGPQFDAVASIFVPAGYAVFAPMRRGHGYSEGRYIEDALDAERRMRGPAAAARELVHLHETEQLDDQLSGVKFAKGLSFVDTNKMVVAGCSFGGIQTLLAAERRVGFKAALPISPGALSWAGAPPLQDRLRVAVRAIDIPVFLIQPPRDASLEPARVLGAEAKRAGKKGFTTTVYPSTLPDSEQTHCFGGARGFHNWASDAVRFFDRVLGR